MTERRFDGSQRIGLGYRELEHREPSGPVGDLLRMLARSSDGVFAVDADQQIVFWSKSAEELLQHTAADVLGKRCYQVILGRDYEGDPFCRANCPTIRAVRRGSGVANFDIDCPHGDDQAWLNVSIVPVRTNSRKGAMAIHMVRDVSDRRRSERLAQATQAVVAQFTTGGSGVEHRSGPYPPPEPDLTHRESEVLRLLAAGLTTEELAERLVVSRVTVRNHIQHLLAKLGVHSRLEAVLNGARHGLIQPEAPPESDKSHT